MPPKTVYTEEKILDASLAIVRREGLDAVTARSLSKELGCSTKPLFLNFRSMEEIHSATIRRSQSIFEAYMKSAYEDHISFRRIGLRWIRFAAEEPQLYRLLFMPTGAEKLLPSLRGIASGLAGLENMVIGAIRQDFALTREDAGRLYHQMMLQAHGIACLLAAGQTRFSEEEIKDIFTETVLGLVMYYRAGHAQEDKI